MRCFVAGCWHVFPGDLWDVSSIQCCVNLFLCMNNDCQFRFQCYIFLHDLFYESRILLYILSFITIATHTSYLAHLLPIFCCNWNCVLCSNLMFAMLNFTLFVRFLFSNHFGCFVPIENSILKFCQIHISSWSFHHPGSIDPMVKKW